MHSTTEGGGKGEERLPLPGEPESQVMLSSSEPRSVISVHRCPEHLLLKKKCRGGFSKKQTEVLM